MKAKKIVYLMLIMVVLISGCNHQNNNMEERLIRLPYVEVQNGTVNGGASDIGRQGVCIAHEDNVFSLRIIRLDLNGHFIFDSYHPIEAESIINEDLAHREHDFEDLKNQIRIKDEKIKDLNINKFYLSNEILV